MDPEADPGEPIRPWPPHRSWQWSLAPLEDRKCNGRTVNLLKSKDFGPPVPMSATDLAPLRKSTSLEPEKSR